MPFCNVYAALYCAAGLSLSNFSSILFVMVFFLSWQPRFWMTLSTEGTPPIPRDSHVSVIHGQSMYVFGGSTGSAMNDFHELRLDKCTWRNVRYRRKEGRKEERVGWWVGGHGIFKGGRGGVLKLVHTK